MIILYINDYFPSDDFKEVDDEENGIREPESKMGTCIFLNFIFTARWSIRIFIKAIVGIRKAV